MKRIKTLICACLVLMLCVATIAVGTYALFSDSATVSNHLQAGTLEAQLKRIEGEKALLDANGTLQRTTLAEKDFSGETSENIFGLASSDLFVPSSYCSAKLQLKNNGSIPFLYTVAIRLNGQSNALAQQLKVYVNGEEKGTLADYAEEGKLLGALLGKGQSVEFTVKVEFESTGTNEAQGASVDFDLLVTAVQQTME